MEPYTDHQLVLLVSLVNDADFEMGLSLTMPGGVVSGTLISYSSWCRKQAKLMEPSNASGFYPYSEYLIKTAETLEEERKGTLTEAERDARPDPLFINLSDAYYLSGSSLTPAKGMRPLWRGKLSEVSGWALGRLDIGP